MTLVETYSKTEMVQEYGGNMQSLNQPPEGTDYWTGEDEEHPISDWKIEVENGDTRAGYWEWAQDARQCDSDLEGQLEEPDEIDLLMTTDLWSEHPAHERRAWWREVAEGNVQSGYWDWVRSQIEQAAV